jgi:Polyketide cyclase / dehydrase and lipid transport
LTSLRRSVDIAISAGAVWDAVRDFGQLHKRIAPGLVTDTLLEEGGAVRVVTFANGMSLRELLVGVEDDVQRIVWSAQSDQWQHHNASLQVVDLGNGQSRTIWVADVLPDQAGPTIATIMEMGLAAMKAHLEGSD